MRKILSIVAIAVFLSACQTSPPQSAGTNDTNANWEKERPIQTRTWVSKSCLLTSEEHAPKVEKKSVTAAIAAVLLPMAIEFVIDSVTTDLNKIKKLESKASAGFNLYNYDPLKHRYPVLIEEFGCITTVTARFEKASEESGLIQAKLKKNPKAIDFSGSSKDVNASVKSRLGLFGIKLVAGYEQIFEVEIERSHDKSAFRLANRFLHTNELLGGKSSAEVIYSYELSGPGATPNSSKYFVASIDLGKITASTLKRAEKLESAKTGWISSIGLSKGSIEAFYRNKFGEEPSASQYGPVELVVKNTQLRKPSEAAKFIASILDASKGVIKDSIVARVLPEDQTDKLQDAEIALQAAKIEHAAAKLKNDEGLIELARLRFNKACQLVKELEGKQCEVIKKEPMAG